MRIFTALPLFLSILAAAPALAQQDAAGIDALVPPLERTAVLADRLWQLAEVGYQEQESSETLQRALTDAGFDVEAGVAGIPTAFVASYGESGPVVGILAEFDALPGINQAAVPERSPIPGKAAGHACGHNLFGAGSVNAAIAVRRWLEATGTPGVIRVYGTPAEEGGSGKVYMVRAGLFDDVDFALHWHAADENSAKARTSIANRSAKFRFRGVSAHASSAPEKARSALDGVEAFNYMANLMREHMPEETRMHYVITSGGVAPNVVPDFAEVYYYLRHPDATVLQSLWARLEAAARGAATGTGVEVDWEIIHGNHAVVVNETLAKMMDEKLREVGPYEYTPAEREFAETIYATLDSPDKAIDSYRDIQPYGLLTGGGSTDVGDVSIAVPTVGLRIATWVPGTAAHSWQAVAASGMSIGFKGAQMAAETLSRAAIELYGNPALREAATAEYQRRVGDDFVYEALLGERAPPLDYRR